MLHVPALPTSWFSANAGFTSSLVAVPFFVHGLIPAVHWTNGDVGAN